MKLEKVRLCQNRETQTNEINLFTILVFQFRDKKKILAELPPSDFVINYYPHKSFKRFALIFFLLVLPAFLHAAHDKH
jgi:hypothetical protein